jgi:hypothetical protein
VYQRSIFQLLKTSKCLQSMLEKVSCVHSKLRIYGEDGNKGEVRMSVLYTVYVN